MKHGNICAAILALLACDAAFAARSLLQTTPAPAPGGPSAGCTLPNGAVVDAPLENTSDEYYYVDYYSYYSYTYYAYWYTDYFYYYRRHLLADAAAAPAPSANVPACCPTTSVQQGDTVNSLLTAAGLQATDAAALFYAFNPSTQNGTALIPGTTVTLPCYRIMEYIKEKAPAAPTPGAEPV